MNAYSLDLRERVVAAAEAGTPHAEIVRTFRVGVATIGRYLRRHRRGESLAAKPRPGMRPQIGAAQAEALEGQLRAVGTDASLDEHCARWQQEQGVAVSVSTMSRALARVAGWTRKKRR